MASTATLTSGQNDSAPTVAGLRTRLWRRRPFRRPQCASHKSDRAREAHSHGDRGAGNRQQIIMLPVEPGKSHLRPGRDCPARGQPALGRRSPAEQQIEKRRHRRQPERPARRSPPHEVIGRSKRPGEPACRIGISGDPVNSSPRRLGIGQGIGRKRAAVEEDVIEGILARALGKKDRRRPESRSPPLQARARERQGARDRFSVSAKSPPALFGTRAPGRK